MIHPICHCRFECAVLPSHTLSWRACVVWTCVSCLVELWNQTKKWVETFTRYSWGIHMLTIEFHIGFPQVVIIMLNYDNNKIKNIMVLRSLACAWMFLGKQMLLYWNNNVGFSSTTLECQGFKKGPLFFLFFKQSIHILQIVCYLWLKHRKQSVKSNYFLFYTHNIYPHIFKYILKDGCVAYLRMDGGRMRDRWEIIVDAT